MTSKQAIKLLKRYGNDQENVMELYKVIEDEIFDLKHNYNVLQKGFIKRTAYATKIRHKLNELKHDVARFIELTFSDNINSDDWQEYLALKDKFLKVGKEE